MKNKYMTESKNKGKYILLGIGIIIICIICIFFLKKDNKNLKTGNNMSNKNEEEIEEYILNISSYEAKIEVTVESNKNTSKYKLKQQYKSPNIEKQTILEPSNIEGLTTIYDGNKLTIQNSKLNATTVYENYPYLVDNFLWLNAFIQDYKINKEKNQTKLTQENDLIIMETPVENGNEKYVCSKKLIFDKKTGKPTQLLIQDINKKNLVYILYNEITVNGLQREEVLASKK